jgi:hypothetical protein
MEGTHRLDLPDGRFILLSSETVDLNGYTGEQVEVTGAIRPTVEEGGTIMRVLSIRLMEPALLALSSSNGSAAEVSSSESALSSSSSTGPETGTAASSKPAPAASSQRSSAAASSVSPPVPLPPSPEDLSKKVQSMARQNLAAANWTQAYCAPPTVGFCFPIHRNWWFKSFGAATTALWHVEVGPEAIEGAGQGPLTIDLLGGSLESKGIADGTVRDEGSSVAGYRTWTKDRHLRISAPSALRGAVEYVTEHLTGQE